MYGFSTAGMPKSLKKYEYMIKDWYEPSGEDFKYDVFLNDGYAWDFWDHDTECQHTELFDTIAQVRAALKRVKVVDREKNCAKCRFFKDGKCIK